MAHITELADMFFLAYGIHKLNSLDGSKWLKEKLERSWNKIIPEGRKMVKNNYKTAIKILDENIKEF